MNHPATLDSIKDTAARYGVSEKTVRRWIAEGIVTGYRMGPRMIRLDRAEVAAMLRQIPAATPASA